MNSKTKVAIAAIAFAALPLAGCSSGSPTIEGTPPSSAGPGPDVGQEGQEPERDTGGSYKVAKFNQIYTYDSGLKVAITKISQRPIGVIFTIKVTNSSSDPFDASGVDANVSYGPDGKPAECCMDGADDYISGTVLPGRSKTGTFGVKLPRSGRGDVVVEVTTDYDYEPAIFQGSIK